MRRHQTRSYDYQDLVCLKLQNRIGKYLCGSITLACDYVLLESALVFTKN